jgi:cytochrome c
MRVIAFATAASLLALVAAACGKPMPAAAGDAEHGRLLLRQYGCGTCHRIPGVATATGNVGPPLARVARRVYLAGTLPNTPANMVHWIRSPESVKPQTRMPNLGVTQAHAVDMVAYLGGLQ